MHRHALIGGPGAAVHLKLCMHKTSILAKQPRMHTHSVDVCFGGQAAPVSHACHERTCTTPFFLLNQTTHACTSANVPIGGPAAAASHTCHRRLAVRPGPSAPLHMKAAHPAQAAGTSPVAAAKGYPPPHSHLRCH
eukprot:1160005-Pelagomonas_calceolata.AAC.15